MEDGSTHEADTDSPRKRKNRNLQEAIQFLKLLKPDDKLRGNLQLDMHMDCVVKESMSHGLESHQIDDLMNVIVSSRHKLSQTARSKLVKCLIPSRPRQVPQSAAVTAVLHCVQGTNNLHSLLLRWLLLVYDHLDGFDQLHQLYNAIFSFTDSYLLLPHACHLLFLLTRRHDVKLYKVQRLMELCKKHGPEPSIMGLLMIYKVYAPHLVPLRLDLGNKVFFRAHDAKWRSIIVDVVSQYDEDLDQDKRNSLTEIASRREKSKSKQQKLIVPEVHGAAMEVCPNEDKSGSGAPVPYTQIDTFNNFLENLDKIEYPSQIAAALSDSRLQLMLSCNPDPIVKARLCYWIQHVLAFGFREKSKSEEEKFEKLLGLLLTFSQNVEGLPVIEGFLNKYLPTWNGQTHAPLIFSLMTCIKPNNFKDLESAILAPLHKLFFTSDIYFKCQCVTALTKLLQNQVFDRLVPRDSHQGNLTRNRDSSEVASDQAGSATTIADVLIRGLIKFLDNMIVLGMRMEDDHYLLQFVTLDFIHLTSEICEKYTIPVVCLPIKVMQRLLLSDCPATLARLCGIINLFRDAFGKLQSTSESFLDDTCNEKNTKGELNNTRGILNGLLIDTLGMLWQGKMSSEKRQIEEKRMLTFSLPAHIKSHVSEQALTIFRGPAFIGLAYKFFKETQPEGKIFDPSIAKKYKDQYLQFLERENFPEFKELVQRNMKGAKKLRNNTTSTSQIS